MGQYYHVLYAKKGQSKITNYNLQYFTNAKAKTPPPINGLKLMEHADIDNDFCKSITKKLLCTPTRICWCGDYADGEQLYSEFSSAKVKPTFADREATPKTIRRDGMELSESRYIIDLDRREYVNIEDYLEQSEYKQKCLTISQFGAAEVKYNTRILYPIALLTAKGNGRGGGDYHGTCMEYIGRWAWDAIEIVNALPKGEWTKLNVHFIPNAEE